MIKVSCRYRATVYNFVPSSACYIRIVQGIQIAEMLG